MCSVSPPFRRSISAAATIRRLEASRCVRIRPARSHLRSVSRLIPSARAASAAVYVFCLGIAYARMYHSGGTGPGSRSSLSLQGQTPSGSDPRMLAHRGARRARAEITPEEPDPVRTGVGRDDTSTDTPNWGIEPVPERLRVLGLGDSLLLWGSLAVSLLVIVAGALLVPALSLKQALLAIVIASVAGCALLGVAAAIGTDARVPAMVLMRAPLGQRGSYLATGLNVVQCLGWSTYELIIIASASAALSDRVFGFRAAVALDGPVRRGRGRARAARADRLRPPLRAQVRGLVRDRLARLPDLVGDRQVRPDRLLARGRQGRLPDVLAGRRPDARERDLLDAARRRLHALLADAALVVLGRVGRLPGPGRLALLARRAPAARPRHLRPGAAAGGGRLRRGRVGARPLRGDRRRERRGVRERLLDRRLAPERDAAGVAAAADRRRAPWSRPPARSSSTSPTSPRSSSCSARSSSRCSAS